MRVTRLKNVRIVDGIHASSKPTDLFLVGPSLARQLPPETRIDAT
jgi:hypothetical protein